MRGLSFRGVSSGSSLDLSVELGLGRARLSLLGVTIHMPRGQYAVRAIGEERNIHDMIYGYCSTDSFVSMCRSGDVGGRKHAIYARNCPHSASQNDSAGVPDRRDLVFNLKLKAEADFSASFFMHVAYLSL